MDTELFNLCKEVYEKIGWDEKNTYLCYEWDVNGYRTGEKSIEHSSMIEFEEMEKHIIQPLYTSDYLLEKLKAYPRIQVNQMAGGRWMAERKWGVASKAGVELKEEYSHPQYTPLKALLKLVIALSAAGELK